MTLIAIIMKHESIIGPYSFLEMHMRVQAVYVMHAGFQDSRQSNYCTVYMYVFRLAHAMSRIYMDSSCQFNLDCTDEIAMS